VDYSKPIEIADNIFWVGYVIPDDPFQCHVYLIKNKDESILIDPGSMITFPVALEKITSVMPLRDIKYIIMHHQDPDIVGCYSTLEKLFPKGERYIVTHWRTEMLLKHYQWETPFYLVDENDWKLKAGDREFEFVFTPYAHFPGAFCTYDKQSKILFSSDLFGGLTPEFRLFAKNAEDYFEYAKPFHKHYIPSRSILNYAIDKVEDKDVSLIAPQHGSIIKKEFIKPFLDKLRELECGIYLMDDYYDNVVILNKVDDAIKNIFKEALIANSFENVLKTLFSYIKESVENMRSLVVFYKDKLKNEKLIIVEDYETKRCSSIKKLDCDNSFKLNLVDENDEEIGNIIVCYENELSKADVQFLRLLFKNLSKILGIALKKEIVFNDLKRKEKELYEKAVRDSLTGLYNRDFLNEALDKKMEEAKRYKFPLSIAMIDIDFFKKINDTYGHVTGNCVLKEFAILLKRHFRESDIIARYGGEEFVIIMPFSDLKNACKKMDDFRKIVENYNFCNSGLNVNISAGVEEYNFKDDILAFIEKADKKLYISKNNGRNRVTC
jgi:two-component system cell cycle response regulator